MLKTPALRTVEIPPEIGDSGFVLVTGAAVISNKKTKPIIALSASALERALFRPYYGGREVV